MSKKADEFDNVRTGDITEGGTVQVSEEQRAREIREIRSKARPVDWAQLNWRKSKLEEDE